MQINVSANLRSGSNFIFGLDQKPKGISMNAFRQAAKAIISRWARDTRIANYKRLQAQETVDGSPMAPLSRFWTEVKEFEGLMPEIGRATGAMLVEVGRERNTQVVINGDVILADCRLSFNPTIAKRADLFQTGWERLIASQAEERKLKAMAARVGLISHYIPDGKPPFVEGETTLKCPPRPFWGRDPKADSDADTRFEQLMRTGRRGI